MTEFPVAIVAGGGVIAAHWSPVAFETPDGVKHSRDAWGAWTAEDWAEKAPGWSILPIVDAPPKVTETQRLERAQPAEWAVVGDVVAITYRVIERTDEEVLALRRDALLASLRATDARMSRPLEDLLTDLSEHEPERYARQPEAVRKLHAERLTLRASLESM